MADKIDFANLTAEDAVKELNSMISSDEPLTNQYLKNIQILLAKAGLEEVGRADGFEGRNTANALSKFLYDTANPSGPVNPELMRIVETYATAENVSNVQTMYSPMRSELAAAFPKASSNVVSFLKNTMDENNTLQLQQNLKNAGYFPGSVDGDFGPITASATLDYLAENPETLLDVSTQNLGLALSTATPEKLTSFHQRLENSQEYYDLLKSKIDSFSGNPSNATPEQLTEVQTLMKASGLYTSNIDGLTGPGTRAALEKFAAMERPADAITLKLEITPDVPTPAVETEIAEMGAPEIAIDSPQVMQASILGPLTSLFSRSAELPPAPPRDEPLQVAVDKGMDAVTDTMNLSSNILEGGAAEEALLKADEAERAGNDVAASAALEEAHDATLATIEGAEVTFVEQRLGGFRRVGFNTDTEVLKTGTPNEIVGFLHDPSTDIYGTFYGDPMGFELTSDAGDWQKLQTARDNLQTSQDALDADKAAPVVPTEAPTMASIDPGTISVPFIDETLDIPPSSIAPANLNEAPLVDDYSDAAYAAMDTIDGLLKDEDAGLVEIYSHALAYGPFAPESARMDVLQINERLLHYTVDGQQFAVQKLADMASGTIDNINSGEIEITSQDTTAEEQRALAESVYSQARELGRKLGIDIPDLEREDTQSPTVTPLTQEFIGAALGAPANSPEEPSVKIASGGPKWDKIAAAPQIA